MAGTTGLEPATSDVTGRRSNQLNYVPLLRIRRTLEGYHASRSGYPRNPEAFLMTSLGNGNYRGIVLDLIYILIAMFFFVLCWLFTKACDRL